MTFLRDYVVALGKAWWVVAVTIVLAIAQAGFLVMHLIRGSQPTPVIPWAWLVVILLATLVVAQCFAAYKLWSQIPRDDPKLLVAKDAIRKMAREADKNASAKGVDGSWFKSWFNQTMKSLTIYVGEHQPWQLNVYLSDYPYDGDPPAALKFQWSAAWLRELADEITVDNLDTQYRYGNN